MSEATYSKNAICDNRSEEKAKSDFDTAFGNEERAMRMLVKEYKYSKDVDATFEKVDPEEAFADNKLHLKPDYFFFIPGKTVTLEIKYSTTGRFCRDTVYVKPHSIKAMVEDPQTYPNGFLYVATSTHYSFMSVHKVYFYPEEVIEEWSNDKVEKKGYKIPVADFHWVEWSQEPEETLLCYVCNKPSLRELICFCSEECKDEYWRQTPQCKKPLL